MTTQSQLSSTDDLKNMAIVSLFSRRYLGTKSLKAKDLKGVDMAKIPPSELAKLGSKNISDPKDALPFNRLSNEADKVCLQYGVKFMSQHTSRVYAIPNHCIDLVSKELKRIEQQYMDLVGPYADNKAERCHDWANEHPEWKEMILAEIPSRETVKNGTYFKAVWLPMSASSESQHPVIAACVEEGSQSLAQQLFTEISTSANKAWEQSYRGKTAVTRRALRPFVNMVTKLDALAFLDNRIPPVIDRIKAGLEAANGIKSGNKIEGSALNSLEGILFMLASPEKMKSHGDAALSQGYQPAAKEPSQAIMNIDAEDDDETVTADLEAALSTTSQDNSSSQSNLGWAL